MKTSKNREHITKNKLERYESISSLEKLNKFKTENREEESKETAKNET